LLLKTYSRLQTRVYDTNQPNAKSNRNSNHPTKYRRGMSYVGLSMRHFVAFAPFFKLPAFIFMYLTPRFIIQTQLYV